MEFELDARQLECMSLLDVNMTRHGHSVISAYHRNLGLQALQRWFLRMQPHRHQGPVAHSRKKLGFTVWTAKHVLVGVHSIVSSPSHVEQEKQFENSETALKLGDTCSDQEN
jgi:hypothetical protein